MWHPRLLPHLRVVLGFGLVTWALGLRPLTLLLQLLRLKQLLSRHDPLVLSLDLVSVAGELVALLSLRPEIVHGEAVVEVCAEVVHDANGKHDIHAELRGSLVSVCCSRVLGTLTTTYLEHLEVETTHDE